MVSILRKMGFVPPEPKPAVAPKQFSAKDISLEMLDRLNNEADEEQAAEIQAEIQTLNAPLPDGIVLDSSPRRTMINIVLAPPEIPYSFYVRPHCGVDYVGAIRAVLSRARNKARQTRTKVEEFKLLVVSVENAEKWDKVTLLRTRQRVTMRSTQEDELMEIMKHSMERSALCH
jgi:hypothetical protein